MYRGNRLDHPNMPHQSFGYSGTIDVHLAKVWKKKKLKRSDQKTVILIATSPSPSLSSTVYYIIFYYTVWPLCISFYGQFRPIDPRYIIWLSLSLSRIPLYYYGGHYWCTLLNCNSFVFLRIWLGHFGG